VTPFFDGTVWEPSDRLPAPYDDPALEWWTDLWLDARAEAEASDRLRIGKTPA
jgi:hypothetical protein